MHQHAPLARAADAPGLVQAPPGLTVRGSLRKPFRALGRLSRPPSPSSHLPQLPATLNELCFLDARGPPASASASASPDFAGSPCPRETPRETVMRGFAEAAGGRSSGLASPRGGATILLRPSPFALGAEQPARSMSLAPALAPSRSSGAGSGDGTTSSGGGGGGASSNCSSNGGGSGSNARGGRGPTPSGFMALSLSSRGRTSSGSESIAAGCTSGSGGSGTAASPSLYGERDSLRAHLVALPNPWRANSSSTSAFAVAGCDSDEALDAECVALLGSPAAPQAAMDASVRSLADSPQALRDERLSPVRRELLAARGRLTEFQREQVRAVRDALQPFLFGSLLEAYHHMACESVPALSIAVWGVAAATFREALASADGSDDAFARDVALTLAKCVAGTFDALPHHHKDGLPSLAWSSMKVAGVFALKLAAEQARLRLIIDEAASAASRALVDAAAGGPGLGEKLSSPAPIAQAVLSRPNVVDVVGLRFVPSRAAPPPSTRLAEGDSAELAAERRSFSLAAPLPRLERLESTSAALAVSRECMRSPGFVALPACLSSRSLPGTIAAATLRGSPRLAPSLVLSSSRGAFTPARPLHSDVGARTLHFSSRRRALATLAVASPVAATRYAGLTKGKLDLDYDESDEQEQGVAAAREPKRRGAGPVSVSMRRAFQHGNLPDAAAIASLSASLRPHTSAESSVLSGLGASELARVSSLSARLG